MKRSLCRFFSLFFMLLLMLPGGVMGATNGCDNEENEYISPALALCSTHVYNIGEDENPRSEDMRGYMRDVVALKSTIMTQQLNKQYEYLESMIRRFKTQLEKAVLTTKLQTSGAVDSSTSDGGYSSGGSPVFKSNDRNIFMDGVKNCNKELLPTDVMTCLNHNMNIISDMSGNGDNVTMEIRKQLANDFKLLNDTSVKDVKCNTKSDNGADCLMHNTMGRKTEFQSCFDKMRSCLRDKTYKLNMQEKMQNNRYQQ